MKRRSAVRFVMWSLAATVGCGGDAAGPGTAACSSAPASQVVLAVGAYTSIDPASDAGCVTIAANGSAVDSAEYLLVPQSASGIPFDNGTLAEIGASWLFVRYAVDQYGDSLPRKLVQSSLTGSANVTAQMGQPFDAVVTRWALANWVSDLPGFTAPPELTYQSWHFRRTFASLNAQDALDFPRPFPLVPTTSAVSAVKRERDAAGGLRSVSPCLARSERPGIHAVLQSGRQRPPAGSDRGAAQRDTAPLADCA